MFTPAGKKIRGVSKMIAEIVALLMFVGPDIKEHRIQESMSVCLKT